MQRTTDVVIVGSGFGGSVMAARLAEQGLRVLLYVADGSMHPYAPGVAPSLTIAALAERSATVIGA